jgi:adenosylcobinamide-GDP ribazoletransferase
MLSRFFLATAYVTSLPLAKIPEDPQALAGLSKYLPVVGVLIGAILAALAWLLVNASCTPILVGTILTLTWLKLTGGIHYDGLMDTADGIFSHQPVDRMLEIMRDPRTGNFGAMAGFATMLLKTACLASLATPHLLMAVFLVPVWSRWCEVFCIGYFPYAKPDGMGKIWHDTTKWPGDVLCAAVVPLLLSVAVGYVAGVNLAVLITLATVFSGVLSSFRFFDILKGQTGDTYGATVEFAEVGAVLLIALIPVSAHLNFTL